MKIMTILGTRPEFIRLSLIIKKLNNISGIEHIIVNTNQNFDKNLSDVFINELYEDKLKNSYNLNLKGNFHEQTSTLFLKLGEIIEKERPDRFFVLGDTNSSLGGIIAKRMGIKVFHLEAGNRSYDEKTPEEVNRRIIDHCSDILMTYSQNSKRILLSEGFKENRVFCVGNPIFEVIEHYFKRENINYDTLFTDHRIKNLFRFNRIKKYCLCTLHRTENVDDVDRLSIFITSLIRFSIDSDIPIILIIHPHLQKMFDRFGIKMDYENIICINPVDFISFIHLEMNAEIVISDSGTVQEECHILNRKCLILRDSTERWETIENGSCLISGCENYFDIVLKLEYLKNLIPPDYSKILEYIRYNVSDTVVKILLNNYLW